jgi:hypothetical protein
MLSLIETDHHLRIERDWIQKILLKKRSHLLGESDLEVLLW